MREIKSISLTDVQKKVDECVKLLKAIQTNKECKLRMSESDLIFARDPHKLRGFKLEAGNIVMGVQEGRGTRLVLDIESNGRDLDRKTQARMFD